MASVRDWGVGLRHPKPSTPKRARLSCLGFRAMQYQGAHVASSRRPLQSPRSRMLGKASWGLRVEVLGFWVLGF